MTRHEFGIKGRWNYWWIEPIIMNQDKPKVFGEGQRVTVDGEPGTVIDSPMRDTYLIKLDTGETVERSGTTIKEVYPLKISKRVPARTKILTALWCRRDFMQMSQQYREIRTRMRNPMDTCHWCGHKFSDCEFLALACFHGIGNRVLCQSCANELLESANAPDVPDQLSEVPVSTEIQQP